MEKTRTRLMVVLGLMAFAYTLFCFWASKELYKTPDFAASDPLVVYPNPFNHHLER